jgi:GTP-binding protein
VYYATQVAIYPPTIVLFTNGPQLFDNTYQRYLLKTLRDHFRFPDVPIKMYLRAKSREEADVENQPKRVERKPRRSKNKGVGELWDV